MRHGPDWRQGLRNYLAVTAVGDLIWETLHLPLYTIWNDGTPREKLIAVLHCTAGDVLIALGAWTLAVILVGQAAWPHEASRRVAIVVIVAGWAYTGFSEWLNIVIRRSWAYSDWMPVIPGLGLGLSPALQWIAVPTAALWAAGRRPGTS